LGTIAKDKRKNVVFSCYRNGIPMALLGLAVLGVVCFVVIQRWQSRRSPRHRITSNYSKATDRIDGATQKRLMRLLNGDRAGAERLLKYARQKHPGHPESWYWQKVIYDLERDRRI
jgi:hypothetical protein